MPPAAQPETLKRCCSDVYESEFARLLLGDSFHPGGVELTRRLGALLEIAPGVRVLDAASGKGDSALFLAKEFGCEVTGVDFSRRNVEEANRRVAAAGLSCRVAFLEGDAERMQFPDASFDCVLCECAFCTFPDKQAAAREFARVLCPDGRIGISDLSRRGPLPPDLTGMISWIACIADALPVSEYTAALERASFRVTAVEPHDGCLLALAREVQQRLLGIEILAGLKKLNLPDVDLTQAKQFARAAMQAIQQGELGYILIAAKRGQTPLF